MGLVAACGLPVPPPDRATLRRFRALVADLGGDFYIAEVDGTITGLVHILYGRRLTHLPHARIDLLLVAPSADRRGLTAALLKFAHRRAGKRNCALLTYDLEVADDDAQALLSESGFRVDATRWGATTLPAEGHAHG